MNKIKAKINSDDFSPWEDSFNNLLETISINKLKKKPWNTLQMRESRVKSLSKQKDKSKRMLNRTFLNLSKINLNQQQNSNHQTIQHNESKRYMGPRISFYAQMNPKNYVKPKLVVDPSEFGFRQKGLPGKKQITSRMIRDQSIKYLEIIEQKSPKLTHRQSIGSLINRPVNLKKVGLVKARISDQHNNYLRRLKMIYKSK